MEFRGQALFILTAAVLSAQTAQVRHPHLRGGGTGTLTVTPHGVTFEEAGKHAAKHSHAFRGPIFSKRN